MSAFLNANSFRDKDLREWSSPRRTDKQDVVIPSSGIPLSQIFVSKPICIKKIVHHDVMGILVTSEGSLII